MQKTVMFFLLMLFLIPTVEVKGDNASLDPDFEVFTKIENLVSKAEQNSIRDVLTAYSLANEALTLINSTKNKSLAYQKEWEKLKMKAHFILACYYGRKRIKVEMFAHYDSAWSIATAIESNEFIAKVGANVGTEILIEAERSLEGQAYLLKAYEAAIRSGEKELLIKTQGSLAFFYQRIGEYEKSLSFLRINLQYLKEFQLDYSELTYISIGNSFIALDMCDSAQYYLEKSLKLYEANNLEGLTASLRTFLGKAYFHLGKIDAAKSELTKALSIYKKYDQLVWPETFQNLGEVYLELGAVDSSIYYYELGVQQAIAVKSSDELSHSYLGLSKALAEAGRFKEAIVNLDLHLGILREVGVVNMKNEMIRVDLIYQEERKLFADSMKRVFEHEQHELALNKIEIEGDKIVNYKYSMIAGAGLLAVAILLSLTSVGKISSTNKQLKSERKKAEEQLVITQEQELDLAVQNQEIEDSLRYAERIQANILPDAKLRDEFPFEFEKLFCTPNILSSDFYFYATSGTAKIISVFSSRTKGVPGTLNNIMINHKLKDLVAPPFDGNIDRVMMELSAYINQNLRRNNQSNEIDLGIILLDENKLQFCGFQIDLLIQREAGVIKLSGEQARIGGADTVSQVWGVELLQGDLPILGTPPSVQEYVDINEKYKSTGIAVMKEIMAEMRTRAEQEFCLIGFKNE